MCARPGWVPEDSCAGSARLGLRGGARLSSLPVPEGLLHPGPPPAAFPPSAEEGGSWWSGTRPGPSSDLPRCRWGRVRPRMRFSVTPSPHPAYAPSAHL